MFTPCSSRVSSGVHKHLYWIVSKLLLHNLPDAFQFHGHSFLVLFPELETLITLFCCTLSHSSSAGPNLGRTERRIKSNRGFSHPVRTVALSERKVSLPQSVGFCGFSWVASAIATTRLPGAQEKRNKRK